jgi:Helicase HerA, central domain
MPLVTTLWNRFVNRAPPDTSGVPLGHTVKDGQVSRRRYLLPHMRRAEHLVILGKTGTGKTSLIKSMLAHDIRSGHGFLCIDLHGDLGPFILGRIRQRELRTGENLAGRTVIVNPADPQYSVGLNILRTHGNLAPLISEVVSIFRRRWQLDRFGARTEELLRNSLWVLAECGMTLLELAPFLTDLGFRAPLIERTQNAEVKAYFRSRYEQLSDAMQSVVREAILNKASAFTTDPAIRHIVGQTAAFDLSQALDRGQWVILQMEKSRLGEDAEVLASLQECHLCP